MCVFLLLFLQYYFFKISLSKKTDVFNTELSNELNKLVSYHMMKEQNIEKIAQTRLNALNISRDPKLDDILNNTIKVSFNQKRLIT